MNEILQQRIEEAAKIYVESEVNRMDDSKYSMNEKKRLKMFDGYDVEEALISFSKQILQNQWISVEEALPPKEDNDPSITVIVHCQKGWCGIDYYRYKYCEWLNNRNSVTHWMQIPSLEGGEK